MDPALVALDFAKAGAIVADMVVSYLAAAPPSDLEGPDDHELEDRRSTPVAAGLHLHSAVDDGASPLPSGEHGAPVQSDGPGKIARLAAGANPDSRPRSWSIRCHDDEPRGLQGPGQRCGDGPGRGHLLLGSLTAGPLEPGLAPPARAVRHHEHPRDRRGWLLRSGRVQRFPRLRDEGDLRPSGVAHHPRAPPRR